MRLSACSLLAVCLPLLVAGLSERGACAAAGRMAPNRDESGTPPVAGSPQSLRQGPPQERRKSLDRDLFLIPAGRRPKVPPFPTDLEWLRSGPLSLDLLRGRIVLLEVWESSCVNCLRSLPVLVHLQSHYGRFGLVVIGVHSPEFPFTAVRANVERTVRRLGVEIPMAADPRKTFWRSWDVRGWPTTYLLDTQGLLAYIHQGEFTAGLMERRVQALLREAWPDVRFSGSDRCLSEEDPYAPECGFVTPEIPTSPGFDFLLNLEGYRPGETVVYADPGQARSEGTFYLKGPWSWLTNGLQRGSGSAPASIGITYTAKEVYAVLANTGQAPLEVEIRQDGRPLTEANKGRDVVITSEGRSVLRLVESRLHYLVVNCDVGRHELELLPSTGGFQIHSFSFGNRCQTNFPHR